MKKLIKQTSNKLIECGNTQLVPFEDPKQDRHGNYITVEDIV